MLSSKVKFIITGGITDILLAHDGLNRLCIAFGKENLECYLLSHYLDALRLISHLGILTHFYYYQDNNEFQNILLELNPIINHSSFVGDITDWNETTYPEILYPSYFSPKKIEDYKLTIGIHPFGSKFSNDFLTRTRKVYSKNFPIDFLINVVHALSLDNEIFIKIFLSTEELDLYSDKLLPLKNNSIISYHNIWESFEHVDTLDLLIGADSAIKGYTAIKRIPTIVLVGNFEDYIRDKKFINPYVKDNLFEIIKFDNYDVGLRLKILTKVFKILKANNKWLE